jgi:hypothetical protein
VTIILLGFHMVPAILPRFQAGELRQGKKRGKKQDQLSFKEVV